MVKKISYFASAFLISISFISTSYAMDDRNNDSTKHPTLPCLNFINDLSDKALSRTLGSLEGREKKAAASVCKKWRVILYNNDFLYYPLGHQNPVCHHLKIIGAQQQGALGEGIKIAVIDAGWFDCKGDTREAITQATKDRLSPLQPMDDDDDHSNLVASIIHGIVPKAQLEVFTPSHPYTDADPAGTEWCATAIHQAIGAKVDFINMSIGWGKMGMIFLTLSETPYIKYVMRKLGC